MVVDPSALRLPTSRNSLEHSGKAGGSRPESTSRDHPAHQKATDGPGLPDGDAVVDPVLRSLKAGKIT